VLTLAEQAPNSRGAAMVSARHAIEHGDRSRALEVLARIARGELSAEDLEPVVSDALVATARAEREERDRAALARYQQAQAVSEQIVQLLRSTSWDRSDLARIRDVLGKLDQELREQEEERQRDEQRGGGQSRRRLGTGSLEAKLIRGFGPYLYYRFREGGRHRSMYVGKVAPAKS
jgi:hypothetical protein